MLPKFFTDFTSAVQQEERTPRHGTVEDSMKILFHEWIEKFVKELNILQLLNHTTVGEQLAKLFLAVKPRWYMILGTVIGTYLGNSSGFRGWLGFLAPIIGTAVTGAASGLKLYLEDMHSRDEELEQQTFETMFGHWVLNGNHRFKPQGFIQAIMDDATVFAALWWAVQFYKMNDGKPQLPGDDFEGLDGYAFQLDEAFEQLANAMPADFVALMRQKKIKGRKLRGEELLEYVRREKALRLMKREEQQHGRIERARCRQLLRETKLTKREKQAAAQRSVRLTPFEVVRQNPAKYCQEIIPIILTVTTPSFKAKALDWLDFTFSLGRLREEWQDTRILRWSRVPWGLAGSVLGTLSAFLGGLLALFAGITIVGMPLGAAIIGLILSGAVFTGCLIATSLGN